MRVLVLGMNGTALMPMKPRKARLLLKEKKAVVVRKVPFTIQLLYKTGTTTQRIRRGVDTGSQHIGITAVRIEKDKAVILVKTEVSLRTTMSKKALLESRRSFRRGRRHRNVRYRRPKFKAHTKRVCSDTPDKKGRHWHKVPRRMETSRDKGWLPPSIESKIDHHTEWIRRFDEALPYPEGVIEIGRFDMARMKDPDIHGEMYQHGRMYDYENVRAYVLARDSYCCRICGAKGGTVREEGSTVKLQMHHIDYRSKGSTDNPDRLITVCDGCHDTAKHMEGGMLHDMMLQNKKKAIGMRDAAFMNIMAKRIKAAFPEDIFTYGNITKADRKDYGLEKSHANDATAIAMFGENISVIEDDESVTYIQQQRKKKRSLHESTPRKGRNAPNREQKRNSKNTKSTTVKGRTYHLFDKVLLDGKTGWITGFTGSSAYIKDANDDYITTSEKYNQVSLSKAKVICHNNNWLIGPRKHLGKD